ncbi:MULTISPECIES: hypothetical protein [Roseivirga]|jgi:hypothetical protein|uniref:Uncharacterized protein n=1 Tax=Roseivirga spongicola TaxID=333140 RepID=A0A150XI66_9BACT|nr:MULTISPECIES: hypothetical protein [Roseivirga]PWL31136.1 MAG: hypothetical protein DCO95_06590 [Roseivirga sp. XM-24bin3]KYG78394.1 hypothetical protein AWW68_06405 [Roseivirga spongicola]MBO6497343.1 hypothetical protein [Roseivirga sp.]MBO6660778.1 hypothetical protein [Roseivirga sp.]MBO6763024.1 hypothetical protein [Roseivirga sp.]
MIQLFHEKKETVRSLLNKLVEIGNNVTWRINNSYSNGIDQTILEIQIFENKMQTGRIAFQLEDGHVINYRYKEMEKRIPVQIVDMLLDVIGYELQAA